MAIYASPFDSGPNDDFTAMVMQRLPTQIQKLSSPTSPFTSTSPQPTLSPQNAFSPDPSYGTGDGGGSGSGGGQQFIQPPPDMMLPTNPVAVPINQGGGPSGATVTLTGTGDPTGIFNELVQYLPPADINNRGTINELVQQLSNRGFDVQAGPIDVYGRQDSVYINGTLYRVIDSSGNWKITSNANGGAWGPEPTGGGNPGAVSVGQSPSIDLSSALGVSLQSAPQSAEEQAFLDSLMTRATRPLTVDPNDPIVRAQTDAYAASQERQLRNDLSAQAESRGPNANLDAARLAAAESAGQNVAGFTGQVLQSELTARRNEILSYAQLYGNLLSARQQRLLQEELAKIDAALAQAQLQQGAYQFDTNTQLRLAGF